MTVTITEPFPALGEGNFIHWYIMQNGREGAAQGWKNRTPEDATNFSFALLLVLL